MIPSLGFVMLQGASERLQNTSGAAGFLGGWRGVGMGAGVGRGLEFGR